MEVEAAEEAKVGGVRVEVAWEGMAETVEARAEEKEVAATVVEEKAVETVGAKVVGATAAVAVAVAERVVVVMG